MYGRYKDKKKEKNIHQNLSNNEVLRDAAVIPRCHPLFLQLVSYYLPGKASFKLLG